MALEANMGLTTEDIQKFVDNSIPETKTYAIDWENGRLSGKISGIDAVHQYIYKTLKTEGNRYLIYDISFGSKIGALVRKNNVSRAYLESDIPRMVKNALSDKRILNIHDFSFSYSDNERDAISVSFVVDTIYGQLQEEVTF